MEKPPAAARQRGTWLAAGVLAVAIAKLSIHLLFISQYGVFRDELYYLDCARHLAWGYVDQPPLIALIARLALLFGNSLLVIRLPAVLAGTGLVVLSGALARELGGGRFAQFLAALCVLTAPGYLILDHILTMNAFEPLFWVGAAWLVARTLRTRDERLWLWFGALAGVGLLNKHSMLFMGFGLIAGLVLAGEWRLLARRWIWIGGGLALLIFLPHLTWQARHGFPQLQLLAATRAHRDIHLGPLGYVKEQVLAMNPLALAVWGVGLVALLGSARLRPVRALGWAYLVILVLFVALGAKVYYLFPVYGMLFAAGGVAWEDWTTRRMRWLRVAAPVLLLVSGAVFGPVVFPVIPEQKYSAYVQALGVEQPKMERGRDAGRLPQIFADMHGWDTMAAQVAEVYRKLTPAEQAQACVFGQNYGEAGAINYFRQRPGPAFGLPRAISTHNSYWLWGPQGCDGAVTLVIGGDEGDNREHCLALERGGTVHNDWARPDENDLPIWICRGQKYPIDELWAKARNYG